MAIIPLTLGACALVDDDDAEWLSQWNWCYNRYAKARIDGKTVTMHHLIAGHPLHNLEIDHINRNKLDNRRCNLRIVTHAENMHNKEPYALHKERVSPTGQSGHRGIQWDKQLQMWVVMGRFGKKKVYLGRYATLDEALRCRAKYGYVLVAIPERDRVKPLSSKSSNSYTPQPIPSKSGYRGIAFDSRYQRWRARIRTDDKAIMLGSFATAEDAARAYDQAAYNRFGEKAILNFPRHKDTLRG